MPMTFGVGLLDLGQDKLNDAVGVRLESLGGKYRQMTPWISVILSVYRAKTALPVAIGEVWITLWISPTKGTQALGV